MSTTSFRLDDDLEEKLEVTATKLQRTKCWIINDALRQYTAREEQKLRMLEETQEAIADIEAQRVVSGEEVMKWLEPGEPPSKLLHRRYEVSVTLWLKIV